MDTHFIIINILYVKYLLVEIIDDSDDIFIDILIKLKIFMYYILIN